MKWMNVKECNSSVPVCVFPTQRGQYFIFRKCFVCFVWVVSICYSLICGCWLHKGWTRTAKRPCSPWGGVGFPNSDRTHEGTRGGPQVTFLQAERGGKKSLGTKCSLCQKCSVPDICFHEHAKKSSYRVWEVMESKHTVTYSRVNQNPTQAVRYTKCFWLYVY